MSFIPFAERALRRLPRRLAGAIYTGARRLPPLRRRIEDAYREMLGDAPPSVPGVDLPTHSRLPARPRARNEILADLERVAAAEETAWRSGRASGAVYHGDPGHVDFLSRAYALHSQSNPLHVDLWPSGAKFEAEVVAMTAAMLGADAAMATGDEVVGTLTSGGTESIVMAMKAYRDRAAVRHPEMVIPESAHVAFDKAAHLLGYRQVRVPVGPDYAADVDAMARAVTRRTVVIAGSAPGFPHGIIDPIPALSDMARERGIGCHTDACLGAFVIPWAERLGHDVPVVDFRLPGVTSMSADTHKYGYAAKGTSVVLYRGRDLRHHQFHVAADWPGGLYFSPSLAGSRPGGLVAATWAAMLSMGEEGYLDATRTILDTAARIKTGIEAMPDLEVIGDPLWVIAFRSPTVSIYEVMARMAERGWSLNGLQNPEAVHLAVTLRHTDDAVAETFLADLAASVAEAKAVGGAATTGSAPLYGVAARFPARGAVTDLLRRFVDRLYDVED